MQSFQGYQVHGVSELRVYRDSMGQRNHEDGRSGRYVQDWKYYEIKYEIMY